MNRYHGLVYVMLAAMCSNFANGQNSPCPFDKKTFQFAGTPVEQARCLLRPNGIGGVLGDRLERLPQPFGKLIGNVVSITPAEVRKYLDKSSLSEAALGGALDQPLAKATVPDGSDTRALYFIVHDTSTPYLRDEPFPVGYNSDRTWGGNNLEIWLKQPVAHIFVNRLGESLTATPFAEPVRKGFGTKLARDLLKEPAKGLQIHIELVQPRRRDPADANANNDRIAPTPGFTDAQYQRLALLYVCASVRRGTWLIPAYHSAIDAGIKDAHDDPQNFDLGRFAAELRGLIRRLD